MINAFQYSKDRITIDLGTLTAAATATEAINLRSQDGLSRFQDILYQYTVAAIATNVVVRAEGSIDNVNWFNLSEEDSNETSLANGTFALMFEGLGEIDYVRFYWVSETGGTAATIAVKAKVTERVVN